MKKPCKECPWARTVEPGRLGGSPPEVYIGQAVLPFWLPCHESANYEGKASDVNQVQECHGAAIFRANIKDKIIADNDALLHLPEDRDLVFSTLAEFYAHHRGISVEVAQRILTDAATRRLAEMAWTDKNVLAQLKKRKG